MIRPATPRSGFASSLQSARLGVLLWACVGLGVLAFGLGIWISPQRAWQAYLVNWLFWSGVALSGITFAAILHLVNAQWAGSLRGLAEAMAAWLPISFGLFFFLMFGAAYLFPWLHEPIKAKQIWLNMGFVFFRDFCALAVLYTLGLIFVYYSLRPRADRLPAQTNRWSATVLAMLRRDWRDAKTEQARSQRVLGLLSPVFLLLYAVLFSLIGFDLVMSLDPHWISTLFGAFFCVGNIYVGLAVIMIGTVGAHKLGLQDLPTAAESHDLGKLIFGFCILWTYLFWCHYLPIWYANLPEETGFVLRRLAYQPWAAVSLVVLTLNFLIPFPVLLSRRVKQRPTALAGLGLAVGLGMWLERYVLVVPSLWKPTSLPLGVLELCLLTGFFGSYALAFLSFVRVFGAADNRQNYDSGRANTTSALP